MIIALLQLTQTDNNGIIFKDYSFRSAGLANPSYQSDSVRYTPSPRLQGLQNQVDEVTDVMRNNIGIALKRGEALDQLEQKAENLTSETERATGSTNGVRYTSPSGVQQLHGQVDEVMNVMRNNIALELERDGALHDIEHKSSILTEGARDLYLGSKELKKKYWWKNQRRFLFRKTHFTMATGSTNSNYQSNGVRFTSPSDVQQLHGQVDEVMNVMKNNIALELERDGALHDIEHKSSILTEGARDLYLGSKELKKKYWWKNQRIWIILYIIVALVITIIIIATVAGGKK
ncbi:unnamed protein product [Adineta steineri]|uniref:V-SNARE coiled-coil homology domain-containing protein n=3 Tax=Adineta steineri TaxID=433720 RepID=A0A814Q9J7_9BILA|nr:unnamed protein product [Adineta steineri]